MTDPDTDPAAVLMLLSSPSRPSTHAPAPQTNQQGGYSGGNVGGPGGAGGGNKGYYPPGSSTMDRELYAQDEQLDDGAGPTAIPTSVPNTGTGQQPHHPLRYQQLTVNTGVISNGNVPVANYRGVPVGQQPVGWQGPGPGGASGAPLGTGMAPTVAAPPEPILPLSANSYRYKPGIPVSPSSASTPGNPLAVFQYPPLPADAGAGDGAGKEEGEGENGASASHKDPLSTKLQALASKLTAMDAELDQSDADLVKYQSMSTREISDEIHATETLAYELGVVEVRENQKGNVLGVLTQPSAPVDGARTVTRAGQVPAVRSGLSAAPSVDDTPYQQSGEVEPRRTERRKRNLSSDLEMASSQEVHTGPPGNALISSQDASTSASQPNKVTVPGDGDGDGDSGDVEQGKGGEAGNGRETASGTEGEAGVEDQDDDATAMEIDSGDGAGQS